MPIGTILLLLGGTSFLVINLAKGLKIGPIPVYGMISSIPHAQSACIGMLATGVLLILLFNSIEHKMAFFLRPLMGLWELYGLLTGLPGDILSYLRLFALGLAGGLLGHAVLNIALMVKGNSPLGIIPMVLVLLFGNALNLGIGLLSAFVHSLRLTFVEFYKSIGFTGGGTAYEPFKIKE
jgi:V/A-type H+-transporting ATPase subunit I